MNVGIERIWWVVEFRSQMMMMMIKFYSIILSPFSLFLTFYFILCFWNDLFIKLASDRLAHFHIFHRELKKNQEKKYTQLKCLARNSKRRTEYRMLNLAYLPSNAILRFTFKTILFFLHMVCIVPLIHGKNLKMMVVVSKLNCNHTG